MNLYFNNNKEDKSNKNRWDSPDPLLIKRYRPNLGNFSQLENDSTGNYQYPNLSVNTTTDNRSDVFNIFGNKDLYPLINQNPQYPNSTKNDLDFIPDNIWGTINDWRKNAVNKYYPTGKPNFGMTNYPYFPDTASTSQGPIFYNSQTGYGNADTNRTQDIETTIRKPAEPVTGFGEGMKLAWDKTKNNWSYNLGKIKNWWNDEDEQQEAYERLQPVMNQILSWDDEKIKNHIKRMQAGIKQMTEHPLIQGLEFEDQVKAVEFSNERARKEQMKIQALQNILDMRSQGMSNTQINDSIGNYIQIGGEGKHQMQKALETNDSFPEAEGWAKVGEVSAGIAQQALPIIAGIVSPPAGIALGVANVSEMTSEGLAQAQMNLDRYEKQTEQKIPDMQRNLYLGAYAGSELLLQGLMQGRYLGNLSAPIRNRLGEGMMKRVMNSPEARNEITRLLGKYTQGQNGAILRGILTDASAQGMANAATSISQDMASRIYMQPDEYPHLAEILNNSVVAGAEGAITGGLIGGLSRKGNTILHNRRRKKQGTVAIAETPDYGTVEVLSKTNDGNYDVLTSRGDIVSIRPREMSEIKTMSFDEYNRLKQGTPIQEYPLENAGRRVPDSDIKPTSGIFSPDLKLIYPEIKKETNSPQKNIEVKKLPEIDFSANYDIDPNRIMATPEDIPAARLRQKLRDPERVKKAMITNDVKEKGIKGLMGENADGFYQRIYSLMPQQARDWYLRKYGSRREAAEEYLNSMIEGNISNPNLWEKTRVISRQFIRNHTGADLPLSDNELRYLLWKARNRITQEDSIEEMFRKNIRDSQMKKSEFPDDNEF